MDAKTKRVLLLVGVPLAVLICIWALSFYMSLLQTRIETKLRRIEFGMTRDQVRRIAGNPSRIRQYMFKGIEMESWQYPYFGGGSGNNIVVLEKDTGKVIFIEIEEEYLKSDRWRELMQNDSNDEPISMIDIAVGNVFYYHFGGLGSAERI